MSSNQNRTFNSFTPTINNSGLLEASLSRNANQRRRRKQRSANRIYERRIQLVAHIDNEETLSRIINLPMQITTSREDLLSEASISYEHKKIKNNATSNRFTLTNDGGFESIHSRNNRPTSPQGQRIISSIRSQVNNQDTMFRIASLPRQVADDPLINQFFNGYLF
ncbi:11599_t:CDS:2 [Funneliformis geosporum]|uniref:2394_t:CDS:1 n=1 Tax=Funneliformis geosporum TaxID=1117311 RepID=A0A9W4T6B4_9GLOM|nr:11599_t:CDS:2 [Funneliformis geosporum]CAI2193681.1 2394_t:CDS:2 [Funneliformis geosporum]